MTEERQADAEIEEEEIEATETPAAEPEADASEVTADDDAEASEEELSPEAALIQQLEADLAAAQAELAEAQAEALAQMDKLQRLAAEFQNSKKRQERQLSDAIQRAGEGVVTRLLPVLDDFDLAFGNIPDGIDEEEQSWVDGFQQIQGKLLAVMEDQGVAAIAREGEFDPNLHEAITSEPNDDVESGHIIETLRVGYEFKGRVLRPAMVRVAS
jgi:molecular chaperone GrpE